VAILILVVAFVVILIGAELFTNGIEWFGHKLELAEGAVGSVLAAVGTALPETLIPIVAIIFAGSASEAIGVGAILGAPFMLSTLAMFVTAIAVLAMARGRSTGDHMPVDTKVLGHDVRVFAIAYAIAVGVAFLPTPLNWVKPFVGIGLLGIYVWYVKSHLDAERAEVGGALPPLRMHRFDRSGHAIDQEVPRLRIINFQVILALAFIIGGAVAFVDGVEQISHALGLDETLLALVIAPIATELPEKANSVLWIRQGKDTLAMGNITGAMVFQSTIPTVVALAFAPAAWAVTGSSALAFASAGIAFISTAAIFVPMIRTGTLRGRGLLIGGVFYLAYVGLVIASLAGVLG
jgi:cation:H+ antiporter